MKQKTDYHYTLIVVAGCGLIAITLGLANNLAGLFFNDIASEFNVGRGTVAFSVTAYSICSSIVGMLSPGIVRRLDFRRTALIGATVMIGATVAISMVNNITTLILFNILRGFAGGLMGMVTVNIAINYWFHKNNALMTSIVMSFSGIVGALLSPVLSSFIAVNGWRKGYLLVAAIMTVLSLPAVLLPISLRPKKLGLPPYGEDGNAIKKTEASEAKPIDPKLFVLLMIYTLMVPCATALSQHYIGISDSYGLAKAGAIMVSVTMVANTAGKLLYGLLSDKLGARLTSTIYITLIIIGLTLLVTIHQLPVMLVCAALVGLSYSMGTVATSSIVREVFGPANYSKTYPRLSFCITMSNSLFTTIIGSVYDIFGSYQIILIIMAIMEVVALAVVQIVFGKPKQIQ